MEPSMEACTTRISPFASAWTPMTISGGWWWLCWLLVLGDECVAVYDHLWWVVVVVLFVGVGGWMRCWLCIVVCCVVCWCWGMGALPCRVYAHMGHAHPPPPTSFPIRNLPPPPFPFFTKERRTHQIPKAGVDEAADGVAQVLGHLLWWWWCG